LFIELPLAIGLLRYMYIIRRLPRRRTVCCCCCCCCRRDPRFFQRSPRLTCELRAGRVQVALPYLQLVVHCNLHFL